MDTWSNDFKEDDFSQYDVPGVFALREWQQRAKNFFFDNKFNCLFEVITGTGKTFFSIDIIQTLLKTQPKLKILIVVPKNVILETGWYKELVDAGLPIQHIGVYYGEIKEYAQITITNMQNLTRIPMEMFDMLILDEVHSYCTPKLIDLISIPFKYRIGLSATLKRLDNKHFELLKIFDYNIFYYDAEEALADKVLNPFVFHNIGIKLDIENQEQYDFITTQLNAIFKANGTYEKIIRSNSPVKMHMLDLITRRKKIVNNYIEKFDIVRLIIKKHKSNKIIIFNQFNDQTSKLYWHLIEDDVKCEIIHSGINKTKRDQSLIDFKNDKFNVLLTSKVLDEGYNLPKLDVAIIMAGDSTDKQTIQRMGRVLRKKDNQHSIIYQLYCIDTIEHRNADSRAKIFKHLASDYKDIIYYGPDSILQIY